MDKKELFERAEKALNQALEAAKKSAKIVAEKAGEAAQVTKLLVEKASLEHRVTKQLTRLGGRVYENTADEVVMQQAVFSRRGVDRIMKYAFELARTRRKHLTSCTKSNGITITMPYWDERFAEMKTKYPDVRADQYHVDGLTIQMVLNPDRFDVIVASNLFGDIVSDLGPATAGTIGIAASGNINPERTAPSIFEPVHGSAPDIAGRGIANPIGAIWSGALMLEHLGHAAAAAQVVRAIERVIVEGPHTPDMKGKASTAEVGAAVAETIRNQSRIAA